MRFVPFAGIFGDSSQSVFTRTQSVFTRRLSHPPVMVAAAARREAQKAARPLPPTPAERRPLREAIGGSGHSPSDTQRSDLIIVHHAGLNATR